MLAQAAVGYWTSYMFGAENKNFQIFKIAYLVCNAVNHINRGENPSPKSKLLPGMQQQFS